jgi:hypothetical protein
LKIVFYLQVIIVNENVFLKDSIIIYDIIVKKCWARILFFITKNFQNENKE